MKNKPFIVVCFFLLLLVSACAPGKGPFRDIFQPDRPGLALFEKAEQNYQDEAYQKASDQYNQYIKQYPDTKQAAVARLKLGMIKMHQKDFAGARLAFEELIRTKPETSAGIHARIAILESYMEQGLFQDALEYRQLLTEELLDRQQLVRADLLAGDAAMAIEEFDRAYGFFLSAFERAGEKQRRDVAQRLMAASFTMTPEQIQDEIERMDGRPPSGYLMYHQAFRLIADGRMGDGISVFQKFLKQYPDHPMAPDARQEMERLTEEAFFEGRTLGCVLPLSGKYKAFGRRALRGIELAVYQAGTSIKGEDPFKLLVRDSASDPETAEKMVKDLSRQQVAAIIGPMIGDSQPLQAAQDLGVPIIAMTQKPGIADTGSYVFRNFLTPRMQVAALVEHTFVNLGCRRFAVLFPQESYGETFLHLFWDELMARGGWIAGVESYDPGHTDFAEPIKKLVGIYYELPEDLKTEFPNREQTESLVRALMFSDGLFLEKKLPQMPGFVSGSSGPKIPWAGEVAQEPEDDDKEPEPIVDFDAIFIPDSPEKAGLIIPQLRYYGINDVYLLGTNLWHSPRILKIAGSQIRQAVVAEGFFAQSRRPHVASFVSAFFDVYGDRPGFIEAISYDSAMLVCEQIALKDVTSRPALRRALLDLPGFQGVTGLTRFLPTGEAEKDIYLLDVVRGRFVEITP